VKAERVVVVLWGGGVRGSETLLDPRHRHVPRMGRELAPRGTLWTRFTNDGWTNHGPSLQAVATGRWEVSAYNVPRPQRGRTLFERARARGLSALVVSPANKKELVLTGGDTADVATVELSRDPAPFAPDEPTAGLYPLRSYDRPVVARFLARDAWPRLSFLLFDDTDIAHQGRWTWYRDAIRQGDELVFRLWERLSADGRTHLLVLPIHGRANHGETRWGFASHGRNDAGCTALWLLALGPDFAPGRVVDRQAQLIDVAPTLARLLDVDLPARGRVLEEGFA
jgi:hypothetical protein